MQIDGNTCTEPSLNSVCDSDRRPTSHTYTTRKSQTVFPLVCIFWFSENACPCVLLKEKHMSLNSCLVSHTHPHKRTNMLYAIVFVHLYFRTTFVVITVFVTYFQTANHSNLGGGWRQWRRRQPTDTSDFGHRHRHHTHPHPHTQTRSDTRQLQRLRRPGEDSTIQKSKWERHRESRQTRCAKFFIFISTEPERDSLIISIRTHTHSDCTHDW